MKGVAPSTKVKPLEVIFVKVVKDDEEAFVTILLASFEGEVIRCSIEFFGADGYALSCLCALADNTILDGPLAFTKLIVVNCFLLIANGQFDIFVLHLGIPRTQSYAKLSGA